MGEARGGNGQADDEARMKRGANSLRLKKNATAVGALHNCAWRFRYRRSLLRLAVRPNHGLELGLGVEMHVSIGILAYNEAARIGATIESLLQQSVFSSAAKAGLHQWEIIIVPNGCTDETARVAHEALTRPGLLSSEVRHSVQALEQGGKSNAWNFFVHEASSKLAEVLILVDADIAFGHEDTIRNCLRLMENNRHAQVVVDAPLKDFAAKKNPSWLERMSIRHSRVALEDDVAISGQFYCARASKLREIWMPPGLPVEDGYLRGMIVTNMFRQAVDVALVARAENAFHYYEGLTDVRKLIRHEIRIVIGTALNAFFMWDFLVYATAATGPGAGELVRAQMRNDPDWYRNLMKNQIQTRGRWVLPGNMFFRRFESLRGRGWKSALQRLPVALVGFALDIPVLWIANRKLRSGNAVGFW